MFLKLSIEFGRSVLVKGVFLKYVIALLFFVVTAQAQSQTPARTLPAKPRATAPKPAPTPATQLAIVKVDSAMVYDIPSFDGAVISYLPAGQKARVSLKTFATDLGQFYRINLPNNKVGYIADIDVQPVKSKKKKSSKKDREDEEEVAEEREQEKEKAKEREEEKKERAEEIREEREEAARDAQRPPVAFTEWVGPYFASWGLKEKISGINADERITVFGAKYTTPKLLPGTILDLNMGFHFGAPTYYEQISTSKPKGYIVLIDAEFLSPIIMAPKAFGYFGLGPLINYTAIRIESGGKPVDSNDLRMGLALTLGYSHRLGPVLGKLEGKYIIEKTQQIVFVLSLQTSL